MNKKTLFGSVWLTVYSYRCITVTHETVLQGALSIMVLMLVLWHVLFITLRSVQESHTDSSGSYKTSGNSLAIQISTSLV